MALVHSMAICYKTVSASSNLERESYIQCTVTARTMLVLKKMVYQQLLEAMKTNRDFCSRPEVSNSNKTHYRWLLNWTEFILRVWQGSLSLLPDDTIRVSLTAEETARLCLKAEQQHRQRLPPCKKPHAAKRRREAADMFSWQQLKLDRWTNANFRFTIFLAIKT